MLSAPNQPQILHVKARPPWMPEDIWRPGASPVVQISKAERRVLRHRKKIPCSEWAEKHRIITQGPMAGSRMRMEITPHLAGQLDAAFFPSVRVVTVCAAPQTAKSTFVDTCMGYVMDRAPGPALSVYPDKETGTTNCEERIHTMIDQSPRLASLKTGNGDDITKTGVKLSTMTYYIGWAGSAISLSNKSIRYLDLQEVDKYKESPNKKEAGTIELAEIRVRAYPLDHKIFITSSPTIESGAVWQALTVESEVIFSYSVACPACGQEQVMRFQQLHWPQGDDDHSLPWQEILNKRLAWYECEHCGDEWDDHKRNKAIQTRTWRVQTKDGSLGQEMMSYLREHRPAKIGFHQPSWISSFVSLSEVAADFLKSMDPRRDSAKKKKALKNWTNKHAAEPWTDYQQLREEDGILALKDERPAGLVPSGGKVAALVAGVDTQDIGYYFDIWAIGWGFEREMWQIYTGFVDNTAALDKILFSDSYKDSDGLFYPVHLAVIDSGGHRTSDVYDYARNRSGRVIAYKGASGRRNTPTTWSVIDTYPGTNRKIPGGLRLLIADSGHFKDNLASKLQVAPEDPGAIHLHSEINEEYAAHMCAEYLDDNNNWQVRSSRANHYWDCDFMALIAAYILKVETWSKEQ